MVVGHAKTCVLTFLSFKMMAYHTLLMPAPAASVTVKRPRIAAPQKPYPLQKSDCLLPCKVTLSFCFRKSGQPFLWENPSAPPVGVVNAPSLNMKAHQWAHKGEEKGNDVDNCGPFNSFAN